LRLFLDINKRRSEDLNVTQTNRGLPLELFQPNNVALKKDFLDFDAFTIEVSTA
jgi:hypothetical protein